jgi:hypothetical protein
MHATRHPQRPEAGATQPSLAAVENPSRLDDDDIHTALKVARYARQTYPGPIGELIENSLHKYVEIGYQLDPAGLEPRLVAALDGAAQAAPSRHGYGHLPARYRPGSPLHWDYW